jgi:ubiquitin-conjugating enzyme E2 O
VPSAESNGTSNVSGSVPIEEVVSRLCDLFKVQLTKAHQEAVRRYGEAFGVSGANLMDLVSATGGSDDLDLNELVASQLAILNFVPFETPPAFPVTPGHSAGEESAAAVSLNDEETQQETTADDVSPTKIVPLSPGSFVTAESVPAGHKFKLTVFQPANMRSFVQSVRKEIRLLQSSLPPGITVRGYEERMDLYSAMIEGPKNTPYEDGIFFFDFQLGKL